MCGARIQKPEVRIQNYFKEPSYGAVMHVFLTGEIQVGKSTALRKFLADMRISADGFLTEFDTRGEIRNLYIKRFDTDGEDTGQRVAARVYQNNVEVYSDVFDLFGARCLADAGKRKLIVMDELGKFEESCTLFTQAVFRRLDGDIPVTGVVKMRESPFLDAVRAHEKAEVIMVTLENREEIPDLLAKKLLYY